MILNLMLSMVVVFLIFTFELKTLLKLQLIKCTNLLIVQHYQNSIISTSGIQSLHDCKSTTMMIDSLIHIGQ